MTKQEKIREAYGIYWGYLPKEAKECALKNNGFISPFICGSQGIPRDFITYDDLGFRPISLSGIGNNNGWVKIESEDDLPENKGVYWVKYYNDIITMIWDGVMFDNRGIFYRKSEIKTSKWNEKAITHYQPIEKPKSPIY